MSRLKIAVVVVAGVIFALTFLSRDLLGQVNVASLFLVLLAGTSLVLLSLDRRFLDRWHAPLALVVAAAGAVWYFSDHATLVHWSRVYDPAIGGSVEVQRWPKGDERKNAEAFIDVKTVWGDRILTRDKTIFDALGNEEFQSTGPLNVGGKPHGHWHATSWKPELTFTDEWFWDGEKIGEDDWNARNAARGGGR